MATTGRTDAHHQRRRCPFAIAGESPVTPLAAEKVFQLGVRPR
jgi:hypothetical protein